ncbi:hypothetical protein BC628DRAFT_1326213 [Trametes gibbosa]|nr:hypothetical protein BC628DRAFT_1326213 [Trametes gibbosa]UVI59158.1 Zn(2)-Cys(6)60 [Trametes gibbosa]
MTNTQTNFQRVKRPRATSSEPVLPTVHSPRFLASTSYAGQPSGSSAAYLEVQATAEAELSGDDSANHKKTRLYLAPDQPLTTSGKPRERVYVACIQCRNRKVRCDGVKPECHNCSRRTDLDGERCSYDSAPRRRGKDRTPGGRKLAPLTPKKTRTTRSRLEEEAKRKKAFHEVAPSHDAEPMTNDRARSSSPRARRAAALEREDLHSAPSPRLRAEDAPFAFSLAPLLWKPAGTSRDHLHCTQEAPRIAEVGDKYELDGNSSTPAISVEPSVAFTRETWWDALLAVYATPLDRPDLVPRMTFDLRNATMKGIATDLRFLFHTSIHWFSFIHIPRFFASLFNPSARNTLQPSLILAALALATFSRSSELELGAQGRAKALRLIDQAHATFNASVTSGWVDIGLVQAAWMLAVFEIQAHPRLSSHRTREAMARLDSLIRCLSLTMLDTDDPRTTIFVPCAVPIVAGVAPHIAEAFTVYGPGVASATVHEYPSYRWRCECHIFSMGHNWPLVKELAPQWAPMPMWSRDISEGEMLKEECRRLVWASLMIAATHSTKTTAGTDLEPQHLWIKDPSNYALLFPGESVAPLGSTSIAASKDSVWALYIRTLLLWHSALRLRADIRISSADRAQSAMSAWLEVDNIEETLDRHSCAVETGFLAQVREILFNTRMCVSHEFQRYIPEATTTSGQLFFHDNAEKWLLRQLQVANYLTHCLRDPTVDTEGHSRRNFLMFWFISQMTRALALWEADLTLGIALDVARAFAAATEYMMRIWPGPVQQREYEAVRARIVQACIAANISPPERIVAL